MSNMEEGTKPFAELKRLELKKFGLYWCLFHA